MGYKVPFGNGNGASSQQKAVNTMSNKIQSTDSGAWELAKSAMSVPLSLLANGIAQINRLSYAQNNAKLAEVRMKNKGELSGLTSAIPLLSSEYWKKAGLAWLRGLTLQEMPEFDQVLKEDGWKDGSTASNIARGIAGIAGGAAYDPLTYVSFGLGSAAKQAIKEGTKEVAERSLWNLSARQLASMRGAKGVPLTHAPGVVRFAGRRIPGISRIGEDLVGPALHKFGQEALERSPSIREVVSKLSPRLLTPGRMEYLNTKIGKASSAAINDADEALMKMAKRHPEALRREFGKLIESPNSPVPKKLAGIADEIGTGWRQHAKSTAAQMKSMGIKNEEIENYLSKIYIGKESGYKFTRSSKYPWAKLPDRIKYLTDQNVAKAIDKKGLVLDASKISDKKLLSKYGIDRAEALAKAERQIETDPLRVWSAHNTGFERVKAIKDLERGLTTDKALLDAETVLKTDKALAGHRELLGWVDGKEIHKDLAGRLVSPKYAEGWKLLHGRGVFSDLNKKVPGPVKQHIINASNYWRAWATSHNLPFHPRNFISNEWNTVNEQGFLDWANPKTRIQGAKMMRGSSDEIVASTGEAAGLDVLKREFNKGGAFGTGRATGADVILKPGFAGTQRSAPVEFLKNMNPLSLNGYYGRAGRWMGNTIENYGKATNAIAAWKRTGSIDEAVRSANHALFDYSAITPFQKSIKDNLYPFATWRFKNLPFQVEKVISNPGRYGGIGKVLKGIEGMSTSSEEENNAVPSGFKQSMAVRIPWTSSDNPKYFRPDMAFQDLNKLDGWSAVNELHPFIKMPYELLSGTSSFYSSLSNERKDIEIYPGYRKEVPGVLKQAVKLLPKDQLNKLGVYVETNKKGEKKYRMDPKQAYVFEGSLPFIAAWGRALDEAEKSGVSAGLVNAVFGKMAVPLDVEEQTRRKTAENRETLQAIMARLQREGKFSSSGSSSKFRAPVRSSSGGYRIPF